VPPPSAIVICGGGGRQLGLLLCQGRQLFIASLSVLVAVLSDSPRDDLVGIGIVEIEVARLTGKN